eukprot:6199902-Pleurochrysis_carterae.AAC.1
MPNQCSPRMHRRIRPEGGDRRRRSSAINAKDIRRRARAAPEGIKALNKGLHRWVLDHNCFNTYLLRADS